MAPVYGLSLCRARFDACGFILWGLRAGISSGTLDSSYRMVSPLAQLGVARGILERPKRGFPITYATQADAVAYDVIRRLGKGEGKGFGKRMA